MTNLQGACAALGWQTPKQQMALVQILAFCGYGKELGLPEEKYGSHPVIQGRLASEISRKALFNDGKEAINWLMEVTQSAFYTKQDYDALKKDAGFLGKNRVILLPLLDQLELTTEIKPAKTHYDAVLVLGGLEECCKLRMKHVEDLLEDGVKCNEIALLGSTRLLLPELERDSFLRLMERRLSERGSFLQAREIAGICDAIDNNHSLNDMMDMYERNIAKVKAVLDALEKRTGQRLGFEDAPTESQMMKLCYEDSLSAKSSVNTMRVVNSGMRCMADGRQIARNTDETIQALLNKQLRRANTKDTFQDYAEQIRQEGKEQMEVLSISSQPYALHQYGQMLSGLPEDMFRRRDVATGSMALEAVNVHHALGSVAKYIYEIAPKEIVQWKQRQPEMAQMLNR